jgi:hypothetical protein
VGQGARGCGGGGTVGDAGGWQCRYAVTVSVILFSSSCCLFLFRPIPPALLAPPAAAPLVGIPVAVGVTLGAMHLASVVAAPSIPPQHVLLMRNGFKVCRVDTVTDATEVIEF